MPQVLAAVPVGQGERVVQVALGVLGVRVALGAGKDSGSGRDA
ncbi:hypothetical protein GCM10009621_16060 [Corynebacterium felinum]